MRRWVPFSVAVLATVLLAGGFGLAVDHFATPQEQPAPQLKTVPAATLTRLGVTLSAPTQPLYCGLEGTAAGHGWLPAGAAGCAISQRAAESTAAQGGSAQVVESVLAVASVSRVPTIGRDHLTWVVVTQQAAGSCQQQALGWAVCPAGRGGFTSSQIVLVDAHSAGVAGRLRIGGFGGRFIPRYPPGAGLGSA
jgi:hypothetical protein